MGTGPRESDELLEHCGKVHQMCKRRLEMKHEGYNPHKELFNTDNDNTAK